MSSHLMDALNFLFGVLYWIWGVLNWFFGFPLVGVIVGSLIGAIVSGWYAKRSSKELREEAAGLRSQTNRLARLMVDAGIIDAEFDDAGNFLRVVRLVGVARGRSRARGTLSIGDAAGDPPEEPPDPPDPS